MKLGPITDQHELRRRTSQRKVRRRNPKKSQREVQRCTPRKSQHEVREKDESARSVENQPSTALKDCKFWRNCLTLVLGKVDFVDYAKL